MESYTKPDSSEEEQICAAATDEITISINAEDMAQITRTSLVLTMEGTERTK